MTGSIAIDVALGLVFIYTLYSLFATTLVEVIATIFQTRARFLEKGIKRMLDDDTQPVFAKEFYQMPLIKYMASGLWKIFNKPAYLKARNFSQAMLQLLKDQSQEGAATLDKIRAALEARQDTQTGKYLLNLLNDAENDLEKFKEKLETWYDDTMARVSGWYKRRTSLITFIVGLVLATIFNVDSFQIVNKLSKDPKAREQYVQLAGQLAADTTFANDSTVRDSLIKNLNTLQLYASQSIDVLGTKRINCTANTTSTAVMTNGKSMSSRHCWLKALWYSSWDNFWGCLITAIALSLGAPFWFDLLNKIVKLRGSLGVATSAEEKAKLTQQP